MKHYHYIEKIKALNDPENHNSVLEILITKINSNDDNIEFQIEELFQDSNKNEEIILNPKILKKLEEQLNLNFIYEEETETNLCFANSNELRSEYKLNFRLIDLMDYIYAFLHSDKCRQNLKNRICVVSVTSDKGLFWELSKIGSSLRKEIEES